jgi:hypothetical protein
MDETLRRRGRPRGAESQHVMVRMPVDLINQIDAYAASVQEQIAFSDVTISRGMAIRELVKRGLQTVHGGQAPAPHVPTEREPEPRPATPPLEPLVDEVAQMLDEGPTPALSAQDQEPVASPHPTPLDKSEPEPRTAPRSPGPRGLPQETLEAIADEWTRCQGLSQRQFAQRLYDKGIYRAKSKDGREVPANHGTISDYLKRAAEAGLL